MARQAAWIGTRLARWFGPDIPAVAQAASAVFRSDLHRLHLAPVGADFPAASARGKLILSADRFFDARVFDPAAREC